MDNDGLTKIVKKFISFCEKKDYVGIILATDLEHKYNFTGNHCTEFDAVYLMRNFLLDFQENSEMSATALAVHLALTMAILDVSKKSNKPFEKVDVRMLKQAMAIVQNRMEKELKQLRITEAKG